MLILVGVSVNVALNGGLFDTAKRATNETQVALEKETLQAAAITAMALNDELRILNAEALENNLPEGWTVAGETEGPYTVTSPKETKFTVYEDGSIGVISLSEYGFYHNKEYICNNYIPDSGSIDKVILTILEDGTATIDTYQYQLIEEGMKVSFKDFGGQTILMVDEIKYNEEYTATGVLDCQCTFKANENGDLYANYIITKDQMIYSDKTIGFGTLLTATVSEDGLSINVNGNIFTAEN